MTLTKQDLMNELKNQQKTLKNIISPKDFADQGQVADVIAIELKDKMKPTQLRKFFHAVKEKERRVKGDKDSDNISSAINTELRLLIPELAYAKGRELITQDFYDLMRCCLSAETLKTVGDLRVFMQFLTAILAYHKFHEKDNKKKGGKQ